MTTKTTAAAEAQEAEADAPEYVTVALVGFDGEAQDVRVLPATRWRASAMRALRQGNSDEFMERVLHPDDYEIYEEQDPDLEGISAFAESAAEAAGEALGKSSGPRRSSKSTRKR